MKKVVTTIIVIFLITLFLPFKPAYASTVTFYTNPTSFYSSSGYIRVDSSTNYYNSGSSSYSGSHTIQAICTSSDYQFMYWDCSNIGNPSGAVYVPNIVANPSTMTCNSGTGWLRAYFEAKIYFACNPSNGGSITYGSNTYSNGQTYWEVNLPPMLSNTVTITANELNGYTFDHWSISGSLSVQNANSKTTTLTVSGTGTITANYVNNSSGFLSVDTTPVKGDVYIDAVDVGQAPQTKSISVGQHTVSFGGVTGYTVPSAQIVQVNAGQTTSVTGTYVPKWLIMMYIDYDNRSSDWTSIFNSIFTRLESPGSQNGVDIVVLVDMKGTGVEVYHIEQGSRTKLNYPITTNVDSSNPDTYTTFIQWATGQYPAAKNVLILHDHGDGFPGVMGDDSSPNGARELSMQDLKNAIVNSGKKIDVVFFHACLMGTIEVANVFRYAILDYGPPQIPAVDYFVGSEDTMIPNPDEIYFPYDTIMSHLEANPSMSSKDFAKLIVNDASTLWGSNGQDGDLTLSAIEINGSTGHNLLQLDYDLMNLANALENNMASYSTKIRNALINSNRFHFDYYVDVYDYINNIKTNINDQSIKTLCDNVLNDINDSTGPIVANYKGSNRQYAHGLTIYVSTENQWWISQYNNNYDTLDFSKATYWNGMIRSYYNLFDYRISISPGYQNIAPGTTQQYTISVTQDSGSGWPLNQPVTLSVRTIDPSIATYTLSTVTANPPFTSTLSITVNSNTPTGTQYIFFVDGVSDKMIRQVISYFDVTTGSSSSNQKAYYTPTQFSGINSNNIMNEEGWWTVPGSSDCTPSIVNTGTVLDLCVKGSNNQIFWSTIPLNSHDFTSWNLLTGATSTSPSIFVSGSKMYIAVQGSGNSIWWETVDNGTKAESGWNLLTGSTPSSPSIYVSGTTMYVAVQGGSNTIWWTTVDTDTKVQSGWNLLTGATPSSPSISMLSNTMYIAVRGVTNIIYLSSVDTTTGNQSQWQAISGATSLNPVLYANGDSFTISVIGGSSTIYSNKILAWQSFH